MSTHFFTFLRIAVNHRFVLELIGEPLEPERAKNLRAWLNKTEAQTLRGVIEAKLRLSQEQALISGMKADDANSYDLKSMAAIKQAHRYQTTLKVLAEIADENTQLETIKLKT